MKFNFKEFFNATPRIIDLAIGFSVSSLAIGFALAISFSKKVNLGHDWLLIERQAWVNQEKLEDSLLLIQIQQAAIEGLKEDAKQFSTQHRAGKQLLEQVNHAAEVIPQQQIEELAETVGESKLLLEDSLTN